MKLTDFITNRNKIPILNIYYLLCYSWDKLEEGKKVEVSSSEYDELINLLGRVLINSSNQLFRRGLDKSYHEIAELYPGIKGKIDFKESLNKNVFRIGRAVCVYDEFNTNNLQNQLVKATLLRLIKTEGLDKELRHLVWNIYLRFSGVDDIAVKPYDFTEVRINRNNTFYDFILRVCRLIVENTVLQENNGQYKFRDFIGSEKQFAYLFESFVRNFYKKEQNRYVVKREDILWDANPVDSSSLSFLPKMETDVTLESIARKIIIETKYYANALNARWEKEKFNSANLYQLYSYLRNLESKPGHPANPTCEGILLYPAVNGSFDEKYYMGRHLLRVKTIDLYQPWQQIKNQLLEMIT